MGKHIHIHSLEIDPFETYVWSPHPGHLGSIVSGQTLDIGTDNYQIEEHSCVSRSRRW